MAKLMEVEDVKGRIGELEKELEGLEKEAREGKREEWRALKQECEMKVHSVGVRREGVEGCLAVRVRVFF